MHTVAFESRAFRFLKKKSTAANDFSLGDGNPGENDARKRTKKEGQHRTHIARRMSSVRCRLSSLDGFPSRGNACSHVQMSTHGYYRHPRLRHAREYSTSACMHAYCLHECKLSSEGCVCVVRRIVYTDTVCLFSLRVFRDRGTGGRTLASGGIFVSEEAEAFCSVVGILLSYAAPPLLLAYRAHTDF